MEKTLDSVDVAKRILTIANERGIRDVGATKLMKLMYIVYGAMRIAAPDTKINERASTWQYGPVFPRAYSALQKDLDKHKEFHFDGIKDNDLDSVINATLDTFGSWTAAQLVSWSHQAGSPWSDTVAKDGFDWSNKIPDDLIEAYFKKIFTKTSD